MKRTLIRVVLLAMVLGGYPAAHAAGQVPPAGQPNIFHRPDTRRETASRVAASGSGNLAYYGGPIMPSFTAYVIFWLPPGVHFSSPISDASYEQLVMRYFQDIGGSPMYNIVTQYPGYNGTPSNAVTLGGAIVDTHPYPRAGTTADPLLNGDLITELRRVITAQSWPTGLGAMYFLYTGSGIQSCFDAGHNSCSQTEYCAYHGSFTMSGQPVIYANMPDGYSLGVCGDSGVTADPAADLVISTTSHEHFEAVTDPMPFFDVAWTGADTGDEIGDKCAYNYGPGSDSVAANIYLNGHPYRLQREWSNGPSACVLSLCGSSVCPPAMTVASTATTCIAGASGNTVDYTVQYENPSDTDAASNVSITDTLPAGARWLSGTHPISTVGTVLTFSLAPVAVRQSRTFHFRAKFDAAPPAFSLLTNTATLSFSDSLADPQTPVGSSAATAVPCGAWCGNGVVDAGEQCDDGNPLSGDGCDANCTLTGCGNGVTTGAEQCDDGNLANGDGCSASCGIEACVGPACHDCAAPGVVDGASCDDGVFCNGADACFGGTCSAHPGDPCAGGPDCDNVCNESMGNCLVAVGNTCGSDGNPCTLDQCDGVGACAHTAGNAGVTCRAAADVCDAPEICTGTSSTCPSDAFQAASVTCRGAAGPCDAPEHCTGSNAACPADALEPSSVTCRAAAADCDVPETCAGDSALCPADTFELGTFTCRSAASACDAVESCTGYSSGCPGDIHGADISKPRITVRKLDTPAGDDTLRFTGEYVLGNTALAAMNLVASGAQLSFQNALDVPVLDVSIPSGAYQRGTTAGWLVNRTRKRWVYVNSAGLQGIIRLVVTNSDSARTPGRITFSILGRKGDFTVSPSDLPLTAVVEFDRSTGDCAESTLAGPAPQPVCAFNGAGSTLTCK